MSVSIRLARFGKKNQPIYRIITTETRSKRNGKYIDCLGYYNPNVTPPVINIDENKLNGWKKKGAIISTGLRKILKKEEN